MTLSPAELEAFVDAIATRVAQKLSNRPLLVDRYSLAEIVGVSVPTVERLQRNGIIPVIRVGRRTLYDPQEVITALSARTRSADGTGDAGVEHRVKKAAGQP